jgi:hypothetical protein
VHGVNISLLAERGVDLVASGAINISLLRSEGTTFPHIRRQSRTQTIFDSVIILDEIDKPKTEQ